MKAPEWTDFMKFGRFNELATYDQDWYYYRAGNEIRFVPSFRNCFVLKDFL